MINLQTYLVDPAPTYEDSLKFLKTKFRSNKERFLKRFIEELDIWLEMNAVVNKKDIITLYTSLWDKVSPFSYEEAFKLKNKQFSALVFSVINVPEMMKNLGTTRIKTEGIELVNKIFNQTKQKFEEKPLTQIYELHKVNGKTLNISEELYAIKCWCTSTSTEHWLWIDSTIGKQHDPLAAIASTCFIYEKMLNNIKHIIRQGDVFLFEMSNDNIIINETDKIITVPKETYFKLLKSQS